MTDVTLTAIVAIIATLGGASLARAQETVSKPHTTGHVEMNGVNYWYEIHGNGEPLLLLHGGFGSVGAFGPVLAKLAQERRVIGVDLQGHGHTTLGTRKIDAVDIGNDLAGIIRKLGLNQVDVMGYSLGGIVAFRLAAQHPALVRRLVIVSAPYAHDGFFPELAPQQASVSAAMFDAMKESPMYKSYVAIAPRPQDFPRLLDAMGEAMRQPYNWSDDVKKLTMPVMLVYGDADAFRPEHILSFYQLLGGGLRDAGWTREHMSKNRLAILPDLTHYELGDAPVIATTVLPFLNGIKP